MSFGGRGSRLGVDVERLREDEQQENVPEILEALADIPF
jgi:hypothetical protein